MPLTLASVAEANAPAPSAVEEATKAALQSVKDTGSAARRDPTTGQFVAKSGDEGQGTAPGAGQVTEGDGTATEGSEVGAAETAAETGAGAAEAGETAGAEAGAGEEAGAEAGGEEGETKPELVVALPGRNGEDVEIEVDSPEVAERLRQLRNGYQSGEQARAAEARATELAQEIDAERIEAAANPLGYLASLGLQTRPEMVDHVVLALLADNWDRLRDRVIALDDPTELRTTRAEERTRQLELRDQVSTSINEQRAVQTNLAEITSTIAGYVPPTMTEAQRRVFTRECMSELQRVALAEDLLTLPIARVPKILADHLEAYGIDPSKAPVNGKNGKPKPAASAPANGRPAAAAKPPVVATPKKPAPPAKPAVNGARFVASAHAKARAAAPPPGAGSPGSGAVTPPRTKDGQPLGIEATIEWHKKNKGRLVTR